MNKILPVNREYLNFANISAKDLLNRLEITSLPIDLEKIAMMLGVTIIHDIDYESIEKEGKAFFDINDGIAKIWLNPFQKYNEKRQRFTLAHEIAHVLNDIAPILNEKIKNSKKVEALEFVDGGINLSFERSGKSEAVEYSANEFAGQLLMPRDFISSEAQGIITKYKNNNGNTGMPKVKFVEKMAERFKVSESAMAVRLTRLGVL